MNQYRPSKQPADWIGKMRVVEIDRPLGTCHSKFPEMRYAVNYGYVPNTLAADGHELDAYVLGVNEPLVEFHGECIASCTVWMTWKTNLFWPRKARNFLSTRLQTRSPFRNGIFEARLSLGAKTEFG